MSNITKEENSGLKDPQKSENILTFPSIEGNSVVAMSKCDYDEKIKWMFQGQKTY